MIVTVYYDDNKNEKETYNNPSSFKEAAWKFWQNQPREGEHTIVVKEGIFNPIEIKYRTTELRDYQKSQSGNVNDLNNEQVNKKGKRWYYSLNGEQSYGPITETKLIKKIEIGDIPNKSLVWKQEYNDWRLISEVPEFKNYFKTTPPPLPKPKNLNKDKKLHLESISSKGENSKEESDYLFDKANGGTSTKTEQTHRWLKFYINIRIPFGIVILLLNILAPPDYLMPIEVVNFQIISIFLIIASSILFIGLYRREFWGWKFNWVFIFIEPILAAFGAGSSLGEITILSVFGLFLYSLPNYFYFKKRKYLFS